MTKPFHDAGARHVSEISSSNRRLMEKALYMRCHSYLADIKAQLLTNTIHEIDDSRKVLKKSHDDLQMILDLLNVGAILTSTDGEVEFVNKATQNLLGAEAQDLLGRRWVELIPLDREALETVSQSLLSRQAEPKEFSGAYRCKDGQRRWVRYAIANDPRTPGRHIIFLYDYTVAHNLREQLNQVRYGQMIGNSPAMQELYEMIERVARGDWTVLIEGETGTGKELVAHAIHTISPRMDGPFIAVNSAALSESLLASQLFGHTRGAFTGAVSDQKGLFEAAEGGTLFLDEIGELSGSMQASLLRALDQHEIIRLGETQPRKVDVRILAATHKDLAVAVKQGNFRDDLYYRLQNSQLRVPPLRERQTDIPTLVAHFLRETHVSSIILHEIGVEAMDCLVSYPWPGNVRELKNAVEYILIHCQKTLVEPADLPPEMRTTGGPGRLVSEGRLDANTYDQRTRILVALGRANGNRTQAAKLLGISRATLYRRLETLSIAGTK